MDLHSLLFSLSFILLAILIKASYNHFKSRSLNLPPGPFKLPIFGSIHYLLTTLPHLAFHRLAQHYGPVMLLRLGQVDVVVISSSEAAREIMKSQDLNFCSRPEFLLTKLATYGCTDIACAPYGEYWRQLKKICIVELLSAKRVKSFQSLFQQEISNLISDIRKSDKPAVNLSSMLSALMNTIIARCAFASKSACQQEFITASREMVKLISGFSAVDLFPRIKYIDLLSGTRWKVEKIHRTLDDIFEGILSEHQKKRVEEHFEDQDLVDVLLRVKEYGDLEIPLTDDNVKAVILDMFMAGTETSSTIVSWAMSELIKNPEIMEKAQSEVRQVLRRREMIDENDLAELHYLKLVIKETLRMHPPRLLLPRESIHACKVQGYEIPLGTRVVINAWALGRDPRYWDDADNFKPERFRGSMVDFKGSNFEFIPFGAGRRICPGISFGHATVGFILASLLLHFNWELPNGMMPDQLDMSETFGAAAARKTNLCLVATPYSPLLI